MFKSLELDVLKREINDIIEERVRNSPSDGPKKSSPRKKSPTNSKRSNDSQKSKEPFADLPRKKTV